MIYELLEHYCIYISTILLFLCPIYSYLYNKYDFCCLQILIGVTSILNHFKLYKYGRHFDLPIVNISFIYHIYKYLNYLQSNVISILFYFFGIILYPLSIYFNNNLIHSCMHILFIIATILLNMTELKI